MKRLLIALMMLALLCPVLAGAETDGEKLPRTVAALEDYLYAGREDAAQMEQINNAFNSIGTKSGKLMALYCKVLLGLAQGHYDQAEKNMKMLMQQKDSFDDCLKDLDSGYICTAEELETYTRGRISEDEGDLDTAYEAYQEIVFFFDVDERLERLEGQVLEARYQKGESAFYADNYALAVELLAPLAQMKYKDAEWIYEYSLSCLQQEAQSTPAPVKKTVPAQYRSVGAIVTFGSYEQDGNAANGKEPIEWQVLEYDSANNRTLLMAVYGLDASRFHATTPYPGWERSGIRMWLNGSFLNTAFTYEEQDAIWAATITTLSYKGHSGGETSLDKVWLLSREEAKYYFLDNQARKCTPTDYAVLHGATRYSGSNRDNKLNGKGCCWWWLRSPGSSTDGAACVDMSGVVDGSGIFNEYICVRPVIWLDLNAL